MLATAKTTTLVGLDARIVHVEVQQARGIPAFELFSRAGLTASNGEARRLIRGGGARLNDIVVESETRPVSLADLDHEGMVKLSAGRKRHAIVRPV